MARIKKVKGINLKELLSDLKTAEEKATNLGQSVLNVLASVDKPARGFIAKAKPLMEDLEKNKAKIEKSLERLSKVLDAKPRGSNYEVEIVDLQVAGAGLKDSAEFSTKQIDVLLRYAKVASEYYEKLMKTKRNR